MVANLFQKHSYKIQYTSHMSRVSVARASYKELKLRISACEYAAPMTFLFWVALGELEVVRQNGDPDLIIMINIQRISDWSFYAYDERSVRLVSSC